MRCGQVLVGRVGGPGPRGRLEGRALPISRGFPRSLCKCCSNDARPTHGIRAQAGKGCPRCGFEVYAAEQMISKNRVSGVEVGGSRWEWRSTTGPGLGPGKMSNNRRGFDVDLSHCAWATSRQTNNIQARPQVRQNIQTEMAFKEAVLTSLSHRLDFPTLWGIPRWPCGRI